MDAFSLLDAPALKVLGSLLRNFFRQAWTVKELGSRLLIGNIDRAVSCGQIKNYGERESSVFTIQFAGQRDAPRVCSSYGRKCDQC
jgi:hypothetical protein